METLVHKHLAQSGWKAPTAKGWEQKKKKKKVKSLPLLPSACRCARRGSRVLLRRAPGLERAERTRMALLGWRNWGNGAGSYTRLAFLALITIGYPSAWVFAHPFSPRFPTTGFRKARTRSRWTLLMDTRKLRGLWGLRVSTCIV